MPQSALFRHFPLFIVKTSRNLIGFSYCHFAFYFTLQFRGWNRGKACKMQLFIYRSLLFFTFFWVTDAAEPPFHSPFTARPLRIRLVNYERQHLPAKHIATPMEEMAERLVAPQAKNMPTYLQQNDEPIQSYSRAAGSYLQEVRRRMRVSGGKKITKLFKFLFYCKNFRPF